MKTVLEFEGERLVMTHPCKGCGKEIEEGERCSPCLEIYYREMAEDQDHDFEDDEIEDDFDCGLMRDGQCTKAGSEECDFSCPNRDSELFAGSAAWNKKHKTK